MAKIKEIRAREILNAKGSPTIEAAVLLSDGTEAVASCPSGTSIGSYEAAEVRDADPARFMGKGVLKAIGTITTKIAPRLVGKEASNQQDIDSAMAQLDGTQNKAILGANAILAVSMAVCKAAAKSGHIPLYSYLNNLVRRGNFPAKIPTPAFNLINGGVHADNNLDFQEFLLIPATSKTYSEAVELSVRTYNSLKQVLRTNNATTLVGDEGGFGPVLATNADALKLLLQATQVAGLRFGFDVFFGIDAAANSFYEDHFYKIKDRSTPLSSADLATYYQELNASFHLIYLEDPLAEDDWDGWTNLFSKIGQEAIVVGDDLTATNPYRLQMALTKRAISALIIKPNQIGTVMESLAVVEVARHAGLKIVVSHRSGETNDDFIADFAVAVSADYVKFGAPARGERIAKYNRLLQIEQELKGN